MMVATYTVSEIIKLLVQNLSRLRPFDYVLFATFLVAATYVTVKILRSVYRERHDAQRELIELKDARIHELAQRVELVESKAASAREALGYAQAVVSAEAARADALEIRANDERGKLQAFCYTAQAALALSSNLVRDAFALARAYNALTIYRRADVQKFIVDARSIESIEAELQELAELASTFAEAFDPLIEQGIDEAPVLDPLAVLRALREDEFSQRLSRLTEYVLRQSLATLDLIDEQSNGASPQS